ncbi:MAG: transcription elongation factor Spt5 [Candidatus Pacearchaeota archaeon]
MIFVVKVTTNKEDKIVEMIASQVMKKRLYVYAVVRPKGLRGYVLLEARDRDSAEEACFNLPYVKGIIGKTVEYDEIKNMVEPKISVINIEKEDIVEILSDPFKKEKAKVVRIDKQKGEVVVSLLGAVVQIPLTLPIENVKVIRRNIDKAEEIKNDS